MKPAETRPPPAGQCTGAARSSNSEIVQHAIAFAQRGWRVLPVGPDKRPLLKDWPSNATTDEDTIRRWWNGKYRGAQLGIACGSGSGLVVIDIDPRHEGDAGLAELERRYGALPATVTARTGGGGRHLYFSYPEGVSIVNRTKLGTAHGVDVRGEGGQVVAPPSVSETGRYEWITPVEADERPADLPPAWIALLANAPQLTRQQEGAGGNGHYRELSKQTLHFLVDGAPEGERNDRLFKAACDMAGCGYPEPDAKNKLLPVADRIGLERPEADRTIESAYSRDRNPSCRITTTFTAAPPAERWPDPPEQAVYLGLAGRIVEMLDPHTESDPVALLIQFLVAFGNIVGRYPHFRVEADKHHTMLNAVLVGRTAKGRKGTSAGRVLALFGTKDDEDWIEGRVVHGGMSSGEGLIWAVRDPIYKREPIREGKGKDKRTVDYEQIEVDAGEPDKRLLVIESEFGGVLKVMSRPGNTLSPVLRRAWDGANVLRSMTKNSPALATGAHISIVGHITKDELLRHLDDTELLNGFGNRFLWCAVQRSKVLPEGGGALSGDALQRVVQEIVKAVEFARGLDEVGRDNEARKLWHQVYPALSEGRPGLLGAALSRAEAQVMRLALLYALQDQSSTIQLPHLEAALALWAYCERSAAYIFGDALGDPTADRIMEALRQRHPAGLSRDEIRRLFGGHRRASDIDRALGVIWRTGRARQVREETAGRPRERWIAAGPDANSGTTPCAVSAKSAESPSPHPLSAHSALFAHPSRPANGNGGVPPSPHSSQLSMDDDAPPLPVDHDPDVVEALRRDGAAWNGVATT